MPAGFTVLEQLKSCSSVSCLINTEPLELLRLQPSEPIASESVILNLDFSGCWSTDYMTSCCEDICQKHYVKKMNELYVLLDNVVWAHKEGLHAAKNIFFAKCNHCLILRSKSVLRSIVRLKFECKNIRYSHARVFFITMSKHIQ